MPSSSMGLSLISRISKFGMETSAHLRLSTSPLWRSFPLILSTRNDCKDFPIPNDNGTLHFDFPLRLQSHPAILLSERSRMDRLHEASRRTLKSIHAKFLSRWLSCNFKEHKDLRTKTFTNKGRYHWSKQRKLPRRTNSVYTPEPLRFVNRLM